jgi:hypothetical protein
MQNVSHYLTEEETKELMAKGRAKRKFFLTQLDHVELWEEFNEVPDFKFDTQMCDEAA